MIVFLPDSKSCTQNGERRSKGTSWPRAAMLLTYVSQSRCVSSHRDCHVPGASRCDHSTSSRFSSSVLNFPGDKVSRRQPDLSRNNDSPFLGTTHRNNRSLRGLMACAPESQLFGAQKGQGAQMPTVRVESRLGTQLKQAPGDSVAAAHGF